MRRAVLLVAVLGAGMLGAVVAGSGGPAAAQIPGLPGTQTETQPPETQPPPETQTTETQPPPPEPERRPLTITLAIDKTDVWSGHAVVLSGRVDPVPEHPEKALVQISSFVPGVEYSDSSAGQARLEPDGTYRVVHHPRSNLDYQAVVYSDGEDATSAPVRVYADYLPRVAWRKLKGSRIEAAMILSVTAEVIDYFSGHLLSFYGLRSRRSRTARRIARTRMVYTNNYSSGRAAAYIKRRVRGARRIRYVFACVHERRPDVFGRPDDPIQRQCGRRRIRAPGS
ncbi:MAG TPA: hypothetical protein VF587_14550 [Solirubrobacteraceae bacterium]|jgi:hypothetical protein